MKIEKQGSIFSVSLDAEKLSKTQKFKLETLLKQSSAAQALDYLASFNGKRRYVHVDLPIPEKDAPKVRTIGNYWLRKHQEGFSYFGASFKPDESIPDGRAIGVEIECLIPRNESEPACCRCGTGEEHDDCCDCCPGSSERRSEIEQRIKEAFKRHGVKNTRIKDDGSIRDGDGFESFEFTILFDIEKPERLKRLCNALTALGATVNSSCGLHVHLDARDGAGRSIATRLKNALPLLKRMIPKSRLDNSYCRDDVSTRGQRYAKINRESLRKHRTIEVRMHSGTTQYEKIFNWVRVLHTIARGEKRLSVKKAENTLMALATLGMPNDLNAWVLSRVEQFTGKQAETVQSGEMAA
jgi:hypothetical protein